MSGLGAGHNKFESCRDCPDRQIEPNCHDTCQGYIFRKNKKDKARKKEQEAWKLNDHEFKAKRGFYSK